MSFRAKVQTLIDNFLVSRPDLFQIDLKITPDYQITLVLDGDQSLCLQDCLDASRAIENNLDREEQDYALQVTTAGLSEPITFLRQYQKNLGRILNVKLKDHSEVEGELMEAKPTHFQIKKEYRRAKLIGKGKEDVVENIDIEYQNVEKTTVVIKF